MCDIYERYGKLGLGEDSERETAENLRSQKEMTDIEAKNARFKKEFGEREFADLQKYQKEMDKRALESEPSRSKTHAASDQREEYQSKIIDEQSEKIELMREERYKEYIKRPLKEVSNMYLIPLVLIWFLIASRL